LLPVTIVGARGLILSPQEFVIQAGRRDGVTVGSAVIYEKNLVGVIKKVTEHYAQVVLPTHYDFSTLARVAETNVLGVVRGEDDFIVFDNVAISEKLDKGAHILTKGEQDKNGNGLPPDLIIGRVEAVNKVENRPFQNAQVSPLIEYAKLQTVFVIMSQ